MIHFLLLGSREGLLCNEVCRRITCSESICSTVVQRVLWLCGGRFDGFRMVPGCSVKLASKQCSWGVLKERLQEQGYVIPHLVLLVGQVALSMQHCGSDRPRSAECFSLAELLPGLVLERGWCGLSQAGNKLQIHRDSIRKRKRGSQDDKICLGW